MPRDLDHIWTIAGLLTSVAGLASWAAQLLAPPGESARAFASVSNVGFVGILLCLPLVTQLYLTDMHPIVYEGLLVTALVGAGSWSFHSSPRIGSPGHVLDIAMGWLLYLYLASVTLYAAVVPHVRTRRLLLAVNLARASALVALVYHYEAVKPNQVYVYVACGAVAHLATFAMQAERRAHALVDAGLLALVQFTASTLQGEFWYRSKSPARYNIEHGYWHLLNALNVGVMVMHAMQVIDGRRIPPSNEAENVSKCAIALFAVALLGLTTFNDGPHVYRAGIGAVHGVLTLVTAWQGRRVLRIAVGSLTR